MSADSMLTTHDVAHRLNCGDGLVRRLIGAGKLTAHRVGHEWRIDPIDLDAFLSRHRSCESTPIIPLTERLPEPSRRRFE